MFRRLCFFAVTLFLVIALPPASFAQADCDFSYSNYARAVQLHDMGDYVRALQHYHCAQLEDPDDAIIPLLIENVYEDIADAPTAWSRPVSRASATACDPALDHARLGVEAHQAGDDNWALIHLHCAVLRDPARADALNLIGMIHISRGESHDAKGYFNLAGRAAAEAEEREDLLTVLLGAEARSALDADALQHLRLTSPDPGETGEYLPPGQDYQRSVLRVIWTRQTYHDAPRPADDGDAIGRLEWALAQDPTRVDLRCELGRRYMAQGDFAAAYGQFASLIGERLGDYCGGANRLDERGSDRIMSAGELERALSQEPARADLRCELGRLYMAQGDYAAAYKHFTYLIREKLGDRCGS